MRLFSIKSSITLAVPLLLTMATQSLAQDAVIKPQFYGAAGLGTYSYKPTESDIPMASLKGGVRLNTYLGLEAEINSGLGKDQGVKLSSQKSVYGVGYLPISPKFQLLGRLGFSDTDLKSSPKLDADGGLSVGIGGLYDISEQTALRFDLTKTDARNNRGDSSSAGLSLVRKF
jgi:hypothetical protein